METTKQPLHEHIRDLEESGDPFIVLTIHRRNDKRTYCELFANEIDLSSAIITIINALKARVK